MSRMSLDFDEYQRRAEATAIYPESGTGSFNAVAYTILGLSNEAGEVAGKLKKVWRDNEGKIGIFAEEGLAKELGDVLWYMAAAANELGVSLEDIASQNLQKLLDRKNRGVIGGSGDNR